MGQRYARGGNVKVPLYQRANRHLPQRYRMQRNTWQFVLVTAGITLLGPVFNLTMLLIVMLRH